MWCEGCEKEFDPIKTHWLCPHCGLKAHCCEGETKNWLREEFARSKERRDQLP